MRKYSFVNNWKSNIKKIMIHQDSDWVYLYVYDTTDDNHCIDDSWFETLNEALQFSKEEY